MTPAWLARRLAARKAACPRCDYPYPHAHLADAEPQPEPKPAEQWTPRPDVVFTEADVFRESLTLDRLAAETARTDPWTAATKLFGGSA